MWDGLDPRTTTLEQAFEPLYSRAQEFNAKWSIAELRLKEADIKWLQEWFVSLSTTKASNWIQSTSLIRLPQLSGITERQAFGSLLICLACEKCRKESREDAVWPVIRKILPNDNDLQLQLFLTNGQPSYLTKDAISDAVRALNLRHAMDIEGAQQWFITLKLQYGFTFRGAKNRLAEWLVNLGCPHAVRYLIGDSTYPDLESKSFAALWSALIQYRRSQITEIQIRQTVQNSPWILPDWIDDILKEAKSRVSTLGTGDAQLRLSGVTEELDEQDIIQPIDRIALDWPNNNTPPRIKFTLARETIQECTENLDANELDFYVDGKKVCRWLRQRDRSWSGPPEICAEPDSARNTPNLRPHVLTVRSRQGDPILEWDLTDSGLMADVVVFDLENPTLLQTELHPINPNNRHALLCDPACQIDGCTPDFTFQRNGVARKAFRLPVPLQSGICIKYKDFEIWQPVREIADGTHAPAAVALTTQGNGPLPLNSSDVFVIEGLPPGTSAAVLLINTTQHALSQRGPTWITANAIRITPELAARQHRIRIRYEFNGAWRNCIPQLSFPLVGAARVNTLNGPNQTLEVVQPGSTVNRNEAMLRIWSPDQDNAPNVYEGQYLIGKARYRRVRLKSCPGHGGVLRIHTQTGEHSLEISCIDNGSLARYAPAMLGQPATLEFWDDKEPADVGPEGYGIWICLRGNNGGLRLERVPDSALVPNSTSRKWRVRLNNNPISIAVTWKGYWCGAHWDIDQIESYLTGQAQLSESDFAILKWLRVPILAPGLVDQISNIALSRPCHFLRPWLRNDGLNPALRSDELLGLDSVARHFLWTTFPVAHAAAAADIVAPWDGNLNHPERYIGQLDRLTDISPVLTWVRLEKFLRNNAANTLNLLRAFTCARLGLPVGANSNRIHASLSFLEARVSQLTSLDQNRANDLVRQWITGMRNNLWQPNPDGQAEIEMIGQTLSGRQYVATSMCCYWLQLAGVL
ncbi:MAG: hypothetical protein AMXMBFR84_20540 [Candidatus Hydrogenedentota bacterium]